MSGPKLRRSPRPKRVVGPQMLMAPATVPSRRTTAEATAAADASRSPMLYAKPLSRVCESDRLSAGQSRGGAQVRRRSAGGVHVRQVARMADDGFRSPLVPLFPICGIALSAFLSTVGLGPYTWLRFVVWLAVGLVIYFSYGYRHAGGSSAR